MERNTEMQANAWEEVFDLCDRLGMYRTELPSTDQTNGVNRVKAFIRHLHHESLVASHEREWRNELRFELEVRKRQIKTLKKSLNLAKKVLDDYVEAEYGD